MKKNKEKDTIDEKYYEEPLVTDNPGINEPIYFNLFECSKNFLKNLDVTCEQVCMSNPKYKYYTKMCDTLTDYNDRNNMP